MSNDERRPTSPEVHKKIIDFIQEHDPVEMAISLRTIFFDYLRYTSDGPAINFSKLMNDVEAFFDLLDILTMTRKGSANPG